MQEIEQYDGYGEKVKASGSGTGSPSAAADGCHGSYPFVMMVMEKDMTVPFIYRPIRGNLKPAGESLIEKVGTNSGRYSSFPFTHQSDLSENHQSDESVLRIVFASSLAASVLRRFMAKSSHSSA